MHILFTRPLEDCSEMILKFQSLGHQVSHIPLLKIESENYENINYSGYGGIIFTSANAVKFLDLNKIDKNRSYQFNFNENNRRLCIKNYNKKLSFDKSIKQYGTFIYIFVIIKFFKYYVIRSRK